MSEIKGFRDKNGKEVTIIFDHLDGMYSYCYLKGEPKKLVHLSVSMPLIGQDGYYTVEEK